jgi:hypothetical protein
MQAYFKVLSSKHSAPEVSIGTRLKAQEVKVSMVPGGYIMILIGVTALAAVGSAAYLFVSIRFCLLL